MDLCKKKESDEETQDIGKQWISAAFDPESKVVVAHHRGKRDEESITKLVKATVDRLESPLDVLYKSDEWDAYALALKNTFFYVENPPPRKGPGRPRNPVIHPDKALKYAIVKKVRKGSRLVTVKREIVYGSKDEITKILNDSLVSNVINTSFIERNNLTLRQFNRRLQRKTLGFSKEAERLDRQLDLFLGYYHFVKPHSSLKIKGDKGKSIERTPLMAANITDRIWSLKELMKFVVGKNHNL